MKINEIVTSNEAAWIQNTLSLSIQRPKREEGITLLVQNSTNNRALSNATNRLTLLPVTSFA